MREAGPFPSLSIITACYNSAATLPQTLASVGSQAGATVEHLIIDGGSTDGSLDIARAYAHIFRLVSEPDQGIYDAMNKGIRLAKGDIVGILNADDFYASADILAKVAKVFEDSAIDACYGDLIYVDTADTRKVVRYWRSGTFVPRKFYWGWMPPHPTFYVRRAVYAELGGFDASYRIAADYDLMLRFLGSGLPVAYIPAVLVKMRAGGASNRSLQNIVRKSWEDLRALRHNRVGGVGALVWKNLSKVGQFVVRDP